MTDVTEPLPMLLVPVDVKDPVNVSVSVPGEMTHEAAPLLCTLPLNATGAVPVIVVPVIESVRV